MILLFLILLIIIFFVNNNKVSSFEETEPLFYVINLPGEAGETRRKHIQNVSSNAGINYTFFNICKK